MQPTDSPERAPTGAGPFAAYTSAVEHPTAPSPSGLFMGGECPSGVSPISSIVTATSGVAATPPAARRLSDPITLADLLALQSSPEQQPRPSVPWICVRVSFKFIADELMPLNPEIPDASDWLHKHIAAVAGSRQLPTPHYFLVSLPTLPCPARISLVQPMAAVIKSIVELLRVAGASSPAVAEVSVGYEGEGPARVQSRRKRPVSTGCGTPHAKKAQLLEAAQAVDADPDRNAKDIVTALQKAADAQQALGGPAKVVASIATVLRYKLKRKRAHLKMCRTRDPLASLGASGRCVFDADTEDCIIGTIISYQVSSHPLHIADVIDLANTMRDLMHPQLEPRPPVSGHALTTARGHS